MNLDEFKSAIEENAKAVRSEITRLDSKLESAITELAQKQDAGFAGAAFGMSGKSAGFAATAAKSVLENSEQLAKHGNLRLEIKAAGDLITTAQVGNTQNVGVGAPTVYPLGLQFAVNNIQTIGASSIEYSRYEGTEGGVDVQATEGATKAAVRGDWLLVNQPSITCAGHSLVSRQALNDSQQLRGAIQNVMGNSLNRSIDSLLWNGEAGLFAGFGSMANLHHSSTFDVLVDAVAEGIAAVQEAGSNPTAVVVSPTTWVNITTAKATGSGEYLTGSYLGNAQMTMHGLPVVLSLSVPNNRAVLIDANAVELIVTQNPMIEANYVNDGFIRNQSTLLIECRVAPVVKATAAVTLVVPEGESA